MATEYKVEVILTPHKHDNEDNPFFWCVYAYYEDAGWCNIKHGWQNTEKKAFQRAYEEYLELKAQNGEDDANG